MGLSDLEIEAQKLSGQENWYPWVFQRIHNGVLCTGAVFPLKKDGSPNYRKADKSTKSTVLVPFV